jgi:dipeptidyl aminopeptidase/acylaminoacyl peptidase
VALRLNPNNIEALLLKASLIDDYKEKLEIYDEILRIDGTNTEAIENKAFYTSYTLPFQHSSDYTETLSAFPEKSPGTTLVTYKGHLAAVNSVIWSPDGKRIASGSNDGTVHLWEAVTGNNITVYGDQSKQACAAAWSQDDIFIISWESGVVRIHETTKGYTISMFGASGYYGGEYDIRYIRRPIIQSPDGKKIASLSYYGDLIVKNVTTGQTILERGQGYKIDSYAHFAWSQDSKYIAASTGDLRLTRYLDDIESINVWDVTHGAEVAQIDIDDYNSITAIALSPNGDCIAAIVAGKALHLWNTNDGNSIATYDYLDNSKSGSIAWSPDGTKIAFVGLLDKNVYVWDTTTHKKLIVYSDHSEGVNTIAWSPDGKRIASGSHDNTVKIWQAP